MGYFRVFKNSCKNILIRKMMKPKPKKKKNLIINYIDNNQEINKIREPK